MLPFFESKQLPLLRILTDRGTEYCGKPEYHEYELYLQIEGIEHSKTKARSPQTNGICERFHRTIQEEFYAVAFRKKMYTSIEQMQQDLDQWTRYYGKTPMQTFIDSIHLAKEKRIDELLEKGSNFNKSEEAEAGSAEEQPARNILTDGNNKAVAQNPTAFNQLFLSQNALKNLL